MSINTCNEYYNPLRNISNSYHDVNFEPDSEEHVIICLVRAMPGTLQEKDLKCTRHKWDSADFTELGGSYVARDGEMILSDIIHVTHQTLRNDFVVHGKQVGIVLY